MPHTSVGRFRKCGEKPRSADQTPVLTFRDLQFCCEKSGCAQRLLIFPRTSEIRDPANRVLATKAASATTSSSRGTSKGRCRKPNKDLSLSPPHVESTATVSLRTSYRNVKRSNKATICNAVVHPKFNLNKTRGCPPLERNPLAKRWPTAGLRFSFRTSYRSIIF